MYLGYGYFSLGEEWVLLLNVKQLKSIVKIIFEEVGYKRFKVQIDEWSSILYSEILFRHKKGNKSDHLW